MLVEVAEAVAVEVVSRADVTQALLPAGLTDQSALPGVRQSVSIGIFTQGEIQPGACPGLTHFRVIATHFDGQIDGFAHPHLDLEGHGGAERSGLVEVIGDSRVHRHREAIVDTRFAGADQCLDLNP